MRALLAALLLAPSAAAAVAYPDGAEWGATQARVPLRATGTVLVAATAEVEVALAPPSASPEAYARAPAHLEARAGAWRGLEGVSVLWLRRAAAEVVTIEVSDAAPEGVVLDWPAARAAPGPAPAASLAAGGLALAARRAARGFLR